MLTACVSDVCACLQVVAAGHLDEVQELCKLSSSTSGSSGRCFWVVCWHAAAHRLVGMNKEVWLQLFCVGCV
jgi:hypothetical protein